MSSVHHLSRSFAPRRVQRFAKAPWGLSTGLVCALLGQACASSVTGLDTHQVPSALELDGPTPEPAAEEPTAEAEDISEDLDDDVVPSAELASSDATQEISFDDDSMADGPTQTVKAPPRRKEIPSFELFGAGGRGGPGQSLTLPSDAQ